jgi:hypothetical protein
MQNINLKLNFKTIMGILFFLILFILIFFKQNIFAILIAENKEVQDSQKASKEMADILLSLDKITLDTTVLKSNYLQALTV